MDARRPDHDTPRQPGAAAARSRHATVVAYLALFVALGGTATALDGKNTVFSDDIAPKEVKRSDVAIGAINKSRLSDDAVRGAQVKDGSLGSDDVDGSIAQSNSFGGQSLRFTGVNVNFVPEGANRLHVTDIPGVGKVLLSCSDAQGASVAIESTQADDVWLALDDGAGVVEWDALATGESLPSAGGAPAAGGGADSAAHVEISVLVLDGGALPTVLADLFLLHSDADGLCYVLPRSERRA